MTTGVEEDQRDGLWTAAQFVTAIRRQGASQGHIARILGVSVASVSRWESGERTPSRGMTWQLEDLHRDLIAWGDTCGRKRCGEPLEPAAVTQENPCMAMETAVVS